MDGAIHGWFDAGRRIRLEVREGIDPSSARSIARGSGAELTLVQRLRIHAHACDFLATNGEGQPFVVRQYRSEPVLPNDDYFPPAVRSRLNLPIGQCRRPGAFFLAWGKLAATPVTELLDAAPKPLPLDRALVVLPPVVRLLEVLHEHGLAAGQLLPHRVLVAPSLETMLDLVETPIRLGGALRHLGELPGTIHPRAFSAFPGVHDMDTELYALGVFAWQLLAGAPPPASAATNFRHAVPLRGFRPDLPPGILPLIEAAVTPRPTLNYPSPRAFIDALNHAARRVQQLRPHTIRGLQVSAETHIGIAKRHVMPINQDAVLAASSGGDMALLLVSDGVSTADYGSGDIASEFIRAEAFRAWRQIDDAELETTAQRVGFLRQIIDRANRAIVDYINDQFAPFSGDPSRVMAATAVIALVAFGRVTVISTGDSPAFLIRDGRIERLNRDQNVLTLSLVAGADLDEVLQSGWPDALAACVGTFGLDDSGRLVATRVDVDALEFTLAPDDRLVLCSDGLTDYIADNAATGAEIIRRVVAYDTPPAIAALELILLGNRGGGGDNVSVALCYVSDEETPIILSAEDIEPPRRIGGHD